MNVAFIEIRLNNDEGRIEMTLEGSRVELAPNLGSTRRWLKGLVHTCLSTPSTCQLSHCTPTRRRATCRAPPDRPSSLYSSARLTPPTTHSTSPAIHQTPAITGEIAMAREKYITFPIMMVLGTVVYLYYTTVFLVINEWLGLRTAAGVANAALFSLLAGSAVAAYGAAALGDPGFVPTTYAPETEDLERTVHEFKRKSGDLRYCQKCSCYKPPRAHHCRVCRMCVLRMDHHCIWINNCVGHANYKFFILSLVYAVVACLHSLVLLLGSVANKVHIDKQGSFRTSYIFCGLALISLTFSVSILLVWHIYLIKQNKTTIEYHEGVRATLLDEETGITYRHPYDLGVYENLASVMGPNVCCWIFPSSKHIGSGLSFRTFYDAGPSSLSR